MLGTRLAIEADDEEQACNRAFALEDVLNLLSIPDPSLDAEVGAEIAKGMKALRRKWRIDEYRQFLELLNLRMQTMLKS